MNSTVKGITKWTDASNAIRRLFEADRSMILRVGANASKMLLRTAAGKVKRLSYGSVERSTATVLKLTRFLPPSMLPDILVHPLGESEMKEALRRTEHTLEECLEHP